MLIERLCTNRPSTAISCHVTINVYKTWSSLEMHTVDTVRTITGFENTSAVVLFSVRFFKHVYNRSCLISRQMNILFAISFLKPNTYAGRVSVSLSNFSKFHPLPFQREWQILRRVLITIFVFLCHTWLGCGTMKTESGINTNTTQPHTLSRILVLTVTVTLLY